MTQITYTAGDATKPKGLQSERKIIAHIVNNEGRWGAGFTRALSSRWVEPEKEYRTEKDYHLGKVIFTPIHDNIIVASIVGQCGIVSEYNFHPIRYEAVRTGLRRVAEFARFSGASVHMPRIGCGLAGGEWTSIEYIIQQELIASRVEVVVYDLPN